MIERWHRVSQFWTSRLLSHLNPSYPVRLFCPTILSGYSAPIGRSFSQDGSLRQFMMRPSYLISSLDLFALIFWARAAN
jgi:hypothetical protein